MPRSILIAGCGQLGSRHLQALKSVTTPLDITVFDASEKSLQIGKERFEAISGVSHHVTYGQQFPSNRSHFDVAIVATNSDVRRSVIEKILEVSSVDFFVLEKLLFQKPEDYDSVGALLERKKSKTWVNCSMRTMPFYRDIKKEFTGKKIQYRVTGSQFGLVTNAIHYLDHMAYLSGETEFSLGTSGLDVHIIPSKRAGFLELNETLQVYFKSGSFGSFTCYPTGNAPMVIEIFSEMVRCLVKESEGRAWTSKSSDDWKWEEVSSPILYQSQLTSMVVNDLLSKSTCDLATFSDSAKIHLGMLRPLLEFVNLHSNQDYEYFPFT